MAPRDTIPTYSRNTALLASSSLQPQERNKLRVVSLAGFHPLRNSNCSGVNDSIGNSYGIKDASVFHSSLKKEYNACPEIPSSLRLPVTFNVNVNEEESIVISTPCEMSSGSTISAIALCLCYYF